MSEQEGIRKRFHIVGYCEISASGKSLKVKIKDQPGSAFEQTYYINRESLAQVLHGHRKDATVFTLEMDENL